MGSGNKWILKITKWRNGVGRKVVWGSLSRVERGEVKGGYDQIHCVNIWKFQRISRKESGPPFSLAAVNGQQFFSEGWVEPRLPSPLSSVILMMLNIVQFLWRQQFQVPEYIAVSRGYSSINHITFSNIFFLRLII